MGREGGGGLKKIENNQQSYQKPPLRDVIDVYYKGYCRVFCLYQGLFKCIGGRGPGGLRKSPDIKKGLRSLEKHALSVYFFFLFFKEDF